MAKSPDMRVKLLKLAGKKIAADLENAAEQVRKSIDEKVKTFTAAQKEEPHHDEPEVVVGDVDIQWPWNYDLLADLFKPSKPLFKPSKPGASEPAVKVGQVIVTQAPKSQEPIVITRKGVTYEFDNMDAASYLNIGPVHGEYAASKVIKDGKVVKDRNHAGGSTVKESSAKSTDPDATEPVVLKGPATSDGPAPVRARKPIMTVRATSEAEAWLFVFAVRDKGWNVSNPYSFVDGSTKAMARVDVYSVDFRTSLAGPDLETKI